MSRKKIIVMTIFFATWWAIFFGPITTVSRPEKTYAAEFVRERGAWRVLGPGEQAIGDKFTATLTETIVETGPGGRGRRSSKVTVRFVDEVQSVVELQTLGLSVESDWSPARTDTIKTIDDRVGRFLDQERARDAREGRDAAWNAAGRDAAIAYFAQERPDLGDRVRRGETVKVIERAVVGSRVYLWGGLGLAAVIVVVGWRFGKRGG